MQAQLLEQLSEITASALTALPHGGGRLIAVEWDGEQPVVRLASDGLALDAKLVLERGLKDALAAAATAGDLAADASAPVIYFKRRGPAPVAKKSQPFGLSIDKRAIPGVRDVIVVASGKGGVGKSTVSVNLAVALAAAGKRVGLLDADIYGPSAPMMLGLTRPPMTEGAKLVPPVAHGVKVVSFGLLTDTREPVIWRGPLIGKALKQLAYDTEWGQLDYLVVDLPPGTGDVQLALIENLPIHQALIVTTPQDVALLDAHKALSMFKQLNVPVMGVVENMAHYCCPNCGHVEAIFGSGGGARFADERGLQVLAQIPLGGPVRAAGDQGQPVALDRKSQWGKPFDDLSCLIIGQM